MPRFNLKEIFEEPFHLCAECGEGLAGEQVRCARCQAFHERCLREFTVYRDAQLHAQRANSLYAALPRVTPAATSENGATYAEGLSVALAVSGLVLVWILAAAELAERKPLAAATLVLAVIASIEAWRMWHRRQRRTMHAGGAR